MQLYSLNSYFSTYLSDDANVQVLFEEITDNKIYLTKSYELFGYLFVTLKTSSIIINIFENRK